MPTSYALTLVAYDPDTGLITHLFQADDPLVCELNAMNNGCSNWIFSSESVDPAEQMVSEGVLVPRPPRGPDREAMVISPRQLFIALASPPFEFIGAEEAVAAAVSGAMPASVEAVVAALPAEQEMAARITWARMQEVRRTDPLVALLAATQPDATDDVLDAFFTFAAGL